jgi:hypothetical protein
MSRKNKVHYIRRQPRDRGAGEAGRSVECCVSKNLRERIKGNRDYSNGLFDTQDCPTASIARLSKKRADTVGQPPSTEVGVFNMPFLKAKKRGKLPQEKVLLEL